MGELVGGLLKTPEQELSPEQRTPEDIRMAREASGAVGDSGSVEKVSPKAPESTPLSAGLSKGMESLMGAKGDASEREKPAPERVAQSLSPASVQRRNVQMEVDEQLARELQAQLVREAQEPTNWWPQGRGSILLKSLMPCRDTPDKGRFPRASRRLLRRLRPG